MGSERRGRAVQGRLEVNGSGEEPTDGPRQKKLKSFEIPKRLVFEAWKKVRANSGAPGVDAVSIDDFAADEVNNLSLRVNKVKGRFPPATHQGRGKTKREAIRALKRRISDRVWTHLQHTNPTPRLT